MFKLIPHCAKGSWVLVQAIGTTPVILGRKLPASYYFGYDDDGDEVAEEGVEQVGGGARGGEEEGWGAEGAAAARRRRSAASAGRAGGPPTTPTTSAAPHPRSRLRYVQVDVDVTANPAVGYIVAMVQGATKSLIVDHGWLLEAQREGELPEQLLGSSRFRHLDMTDYVHVDVDAMAKQGELGGVIPMVSARVGAAAASSAAYDAEALAMAAAAR
jgi:hypothetical protein